MRSSSGDAAARRGKIGGSDANILLSGDPHRIRQLWLEKCGEAEPADLSDNLSVMLGSWTEAFHLSALLVAVGVLLVLLGVVLHPTSTL